MATIAKIREMAAIRLGILDPESETLPSYESADLTKAYNEVHAQLSAKNVVTWDIDEDIPDEYAGHIADLVAFARVNDYAPDPARYQRIVNNRAIAIPEMRELRTSDTFTQPLTEYF